MPAFRTQRGGLRLLAWDEEGEPLSPEVLLTIVALIEYEAGEGNVAVPPDAPATIDAVAEAFHGSALRLNGTASAPGALCPAALAADALFAAWPYLRPYGVTASGCTRWPEGSHFSLCRREVALRGDRGAVMQALAEGLPGLEDTGAGLRLRQGESWVYLAPLTRRAALRWSARPSARSWPGSCAIFTPERSGRWTLIRPAKNKGILFLQIVVY